MEDIDEALPDPVGVDRGHEVVTLLNVTAKLVDLTGWSLCDGVDGRTDLARLLAGGAITQITALAATSLGNRADRILLVDPTGSLVDQTTYRAEYLFRAMTLAGPGRSGPRGDIQERLALEPDVGVDLDAVFGSHPPCAGACAARRSRRPPQR